MVFIVLLASPVFATVNVDNYPRLDTINMIMCTNETDEITKASTGILDTAWDIRSPANVATLQGLTPPWYISTNDGYGFHYWGINCRDYTPDTSGLEVDYHGRTPGVPLFPLNISRFRYALHLLIGGSVTDNALSATFGWTQKRIDTIPAPAAGQWYNSELPPIPYDPAQAMSILADLDGAGHGFSNATGDWICNIPGHVGELRTIYVLGSTQAIHSTTQMSLYYCTAWNNFFGKDSHGNYYFGGSPSNIANVDVMDFTLVVEIYSDDRDMDIWGGGWNVGRDPDYLFDFFNSAKDGFGDYNSPGIHDPIVDKDTYAIKYWMWPNGTYITTLAEMVSIAWEAEEALYYLTPYMTKYCSVVVNAFNPGLKSWIESLGYGSDTGWSYNWIYWSDTTKTSIKECDSSWPSHLNPEVASTVYDFEILSRLYDGLFDIEPFLHKDINWAMTGYTIAPWIQPSVGVTAGQAVTINLRHNLYWQNGDHINASDVKWNYDFLIDQQPARYSDILLTYYNTTLYPSDPYKLTLYINCTGIWTVYTYFGNALIFPEKVWAHWLGDSAGGQAWQPEKQNYDAWTGETGHGALTCLYGTGAWLFVSYDEIAGAATLIANRANAMYTGNTGYWAKNFLREDLNFDGIVDLFDAVLLSGAAGATPSNPRWNYGQADITADYIVDLFDAVRLAGHAGAITLPS
jgi:ABC-type transport system substrate-binding protein